MTVFLNIGKFSLFRGGSTHIFVERYLPFSNFSSSLSSLLERSAGVLLAYSYFHSSQSFVGMLKSIELSFNCVCSNISKKNVII